MLSEYPSAIGWTLFQKMFGGRSSMSRSTFESHNDKAKQWNYFLLAIKLLQIRCTYIAILIHHNLVTFVIQWHFVIITVYNVDKSGNFVCFFLIKVARWQGSQTCSCHKKAFPQQKSKIWQQVHKILGMTLKLFNCCKKVISTF